MNAGGEGTPRRPEGLRPGGRADHVVQLYPDGTAMVDSVARFLRGALSGDGAAVAIATLPHLDALEAALGDDIDLEGARSAGRYRSFESAEVLWSLTDGDGHPDASDFRRIVGGILEEVSAERPLHVFGEMAAELWQAGSIAGALQLEDLWNGLLSSGPYRLLCAYPEQLRGGLGALSALYARHSQVITSRTDLRC